MLSGRPALTLTGIGENCLMPDMKALAARSRVELAFLYSLDAAGPRFVSRRTLDRVLPALGGRLALHVCGEGARRELLAGSLQSWMPYLARVQVNGLVTEKELPLLVRQVPVLITQYMKGNQPLVRLPLANHAVLVDSSGGLGIRPRHWARPPTGKAVGFAGGLGPDNLRAEWPRIQRVARGGAWVDMETSLRDAHDQFDPERAHAVIDVMDALHPDPTAACAPIK